MTGFTTLTGDLFGFEEQLSGTEREIVMRVRSGNGGCPPWHAWRRSARSR